MYDIFQKLLDEKRIKAADVARATGIASSTLSEWKKGVSVPKNDKMLKIAEFLGVSVEYLTTGKEPLNPLLTSDKAVLGAKILTDIEILDVLEMYYELSTERQKDIKNIIKMFHENDLGGK